MPLESTWVISDGAPRTRYQTLEETKLLGSLRTYSSSSYSSNHLTNGLASTEGSSNSGCSLCRGVYLVPA